MAWQLKSISRIQLVFCCHFCLASMNSCLFEKTSTNSCTLVGPPGTNTSQQTRIKGPWSIMNMNRFCFRGCHCPPGFGKVKRMFAFPCVAYCLLLEFPPSPLSQVFFFPLFFKKKHLQSFFKKKNLNPRFLPLQLNSVQHEEEFSFIRLDEGFERIPFDWKRIWEECKRPL